MADIVKTELLIGGYILGTIDIDDTDTDIGYNALYRYYYVVSQKDMTHYYIKEDVFERLKKNPYKFFIYMMMI